MQGRLIGAGIVALVLLMAGIIFSPIATVDAGHRGIVTRFGKVLPETLEPGMSIISPATQEALKAGPKYPAELSSGGKSPSQGGAAYVNLEAIRKWNGTLPTMMMGGNAVPFVNIGK